jgi:acetoacetyl-CoA synthetase
MGKRPDAFAAGPSYIPQLRLYQDWLAAKRGLSFDSYDALWRWSITDLDAFWQSIWDYFDLQSPHRTQRCWPQRAMPGAQWFPGAQVNYAQQVLRHVDAAHACGLFRHPQPQREKPGWRTAPRIELARTARQVASLALHLRALGVQPGDRVAAYLPNGPRGHGRVFGHASIGGVWSICAPDMGTNAVLDRFQQIEPPRC